MIGTKITLWRIGRPFRAIFFAGLLVCSGTIALAFDGYSDPLSPSTMEDVVTTPTVPFYEINERLRQVNELIEKEASVLQSLALLTPAKQSDEFGYHSDYIPAIEGVPEEPLWTLTFDMTIKNRTIQGFVMVPAMDQRSPDLKGYAFPKRFRISLVDNKGKLLKVWVDWTERDFPDPGMRPVFFRFPTNVDPSTISRQGLKLEVFGGHEENGLEIFALSRVHMIRTAELHQPRKIIASSSFESAPYWSANHLASSRDTLGMPLADKKEPAGDFIWKLPASNLKDPLVISMKLDQPDQLRWINFFPGRSPDGINVPGYGFPQSIKIYRLLKRPNEEGYRRFLVKGPENYANPGNNIMRISDVARRIDGLEIEFNDFPLYQGQAVFALGEIEAFIQGRNLFKGCNITIRKNEIEGCPDLSTLVDGRVDGREILTLIEWHNQLAEGKPHEARLKVLERERQHLTNRWKRLRQGSLTGASVLLIIGTLSTILILIRSKRRAETLLRKQISSDLHDEVGSSLGSISLMVGQLERMASNTRMKEGLLDVSLVAREAVASLREVVWVTDQSTIRLPALIQKLSERVARVLSEVDLVIEIPKDCPDLVVSLKLKRHLLMFFKEVVHNCARHAQATRVQVSVSVELHQFHLMVCDNGRGFDSSAPTNGWGLASMNKRAEEMGGKMEISSREGAGTWIRLTVPLTALSKAPNKAYKTSN